MRAVITVSLLAIAHPMAARAQDPMTVVRSAERAIDRGEGNAIRQALVARPTSRTARLGAATVARLSYDLRTADSLYTSLLPADGTAPDRLAIWARLGLGLSRAARWNASDADAILTRAADEAGAAGDRVVQVEALVRLSLLRGRTQGVAAGLALLDRAEQIRPRSDTAGLAGIATVRAQLLLARGDTGAASLAETARRLGRAIGRSRVEGLALQILAREQLRLGRPDSAIALYGRSARMLKAVNERAGYAVALQWRGFLLRSDGDLGAARHDLEEALGAGDAAGALTLGWTHLNLGQIALTLADWRGAHEHFAQARTLLGEIGDQWGIALALHSEGVTRRATRDWRAADSLLATAERMLVASGNRSDVQGLRLERVRTAISRRDWAAATRLLGLAQDTAATRASAAQLDVEYYAGLIALGQGHPADALRIFSRQGAGGAPTPEMYRRSARIAEAYALLGRPDSAEVWARTALDALERWRTTQGARADRLGALGANGDVADPDVGFASVAAVLARDGRLDAAFELAERLAARELLDALLRRDALRIEPSDRPRTRPATDVATVARRGTAPAPIALAELQGMLSDSAAIVEFVTGAWGEATTGIVVTRQRRQTVGLAAADSLIGPINRFRSSLQAGNWPRPLARSLGDALLAPIAAVLPPEVTQIVIVGGTLLQAVPFDALELPDGRPAIERFEISYAPSASVAALLMRRPAHSGNGGVLALGASARPRGTAHPGWDSLPELPGAAREARRIAGFFGLAETRVGAQATEAAIKSAAGQRASVVHIAAHAVVDPSAMGETALLLAPGGGEDGILRPEEIGEMTLAADIVVLSACRTTRIDVSYGDEGFRGLVTPLFEAGARSVVATAWPVDDAKQIALADRFYRGLADGQSAGAALRAAKLAALHAGVAPREWAAVMLWGDPEARPAGKMRKPLLPLAVFSTGRDD